ncbi:MAG: DUF350 domain-containing protein [Candidatus Saccharibacteria bacterium]|nr:DUF350 domain-containing protein [Candidatus Saccharibacteria bacterium]
MDYSTAIGMQVTKAGVGLTWTAVAATVVYALLGVALMALCMWLANVVFKLNLRHELVKDNNVGLGVAVAGMAVAIAIIIAGTISS